MTLRTYGKTYAGIVTCCEHARAGRVALSVCTIQMLPYVLKIVKERHCQSRVQIQISEYGTNIAHVYITHEN